MDEHRADQQNVPVDSRKTLFLVDRSDSFIMYLRILLERMGFRVVPLKKWKLLRELLPIVGPDLVLLGSPAENPEPLEALAGLRADGAAVPVILISARDEDELGFDCRAAGFAGCLSRPINIFNLFRVLYDTIVFSSGEKRLHLRTPFRERVAVGRAGGATVLRATSLSEGGMFIRTKEPFTKGERLTIEVPLGFGPAEKLAAEVIYARTTLGDADQGETGVAIRFTELTQEQAAQLTVCVLSLLVGDILEDQEEPVVSLVSRTNSLYEDIVADHIRLGQELKQSQQLTRHIMDALPTGMLTFRVGSDGELEVLSANPAAERLLCAGDTPEQRRAAFSPAWWGAGLADEVRRVAHEGGSVQVSNVRLVRGALDGYFDFTIFRLDPGRAAVLFGNISERRKDEAESLRLQKLESLGFLAGGIAHDFNNLLQLISGSVDTAQTLLGTAAENCPPAKVGRVQYLLAQARRGVDRATQISSQLLTFARGGDPVVQPLDIGPVVNEAFEFALHGSGVLGRIALREDVRRVRGDAGQLHQVFTNIALNAMQSMPRGGEVVVSGANLAVGPGHVALQAGDYVRISIRDEGVGIPAEILPNVCDPYFTTKQAGSGLGLSNAFSIVRKHGGWIDIESRVGQGTTVHVTLPVAVEAPRASPRREEAARPSPGGRVLVMDDEEPLCAMFSEMLELLGYTAACVPDGQQMLRAYETAARAGEPFDVVIMDLTVRGGMGGEEAVRALLALDPAAKAIVSSGYSDAPVLARYRDYGFCAALPKPFSGRVLALVLEEVLEE
jgi:signal transduction histidine kinase/DNA-binding response OmpR family regulator